MISKERALDKAKQYVGIMAEMEAAIDALADAAVESTYGKGFKIKTIILHLELQKIYVQFQLEARGVCHEVFNLFVMQRCKDNGWINTVVDDYNQNIIMD